MSGDRRYDEREVGQILERVAELHEHEGETADARGMTRGELEQVVQELAVIKACVSRADSRVAPSPPPHGAPVCVISAEYEHIRARSNERV